jgi:DNA-binding MarR family transcriptional regulator
MTSEDLHPTIKEFVIKYLQDQSDDITLEEIQEFLFLKQQILRGQSDLREGRSYSQQQVKEIVKKWTQ